MRGRLTLWVTLGLTSLASGARSDEWLTPRRDPARTARSLGVMPSDPPVATWRAYMGARPTAEYVHFRPGSKVVVSARGGRAVAKHLLSQHVLWQSEQLGDLAIVDVTDLDGDGSLEVVVHTTSAAVVLDYGSGATLWRSPPDQFVFLSRVTAVDLDADHRPEIYLDECSGCAKAGTTTAGAFTFKSGVSSGVPLWNRPAGASPIPLHSGSDGVVDLDGDGLPEIALASQDGLELVRGTDGKQIAFLTHPTEPQFFKQGFASEFEADAKPGRELLAIQPQGQMQVAGPPGLAAYSVTPGSGKWSVLWTATAGGYDAEIVSVSDIVSDVDGDGRDEVILSFRPNHTSIAWTTRLLDGLTGTVRAELAGARFEGAADLDEKPGLELVVATTAGIRAWKASGQGLSPLTPVLPGVRAFSASDHALRMKTALNRRLAVARRAPGPARIFVGVPSSPVALDSLGPASTFKSAQEVSVSSGVWVLGDKYSPLVGEITDAIAAHGTTRPYEQMAFGTSMGTVDVLDSKMNVTNGITKVFGQRIGTLVGGVAAGSYARGGNLVASDTGGPFVVLPDGAFGLWVGDAAAASWIIPPPPRWIRPGVTAASVIGLGGMGQSVVGVEGYSLVAHRSSDGFELGRFALGPGSAVTPPMPMKVGKLTPLVGIDWRVTGVQVVQHAVDFSSQTEPWTAPPLPYGGFFGSSIGDVDGNGIDEWYSMNGPLNRRSALTGAIDAFAAPTTGYALPMLSAFTGSATEILLQSGYGSPKLVSAEIKQLWAGTTPEPMNGIAGARSACGGAVRFVSSAVNSPVLRAYDGKTGAIVATSVLAAGKSYGSSEAAKADGAQVGFLSNASAVNQLGSGFGAVFVGSTDGRLYAADPCTLSVLWSINLDAPVGEPSIGDYDGDGTDEIVVGTTAGFTFGIDWPALAKPKWITIGSDSSNAPATTKPGQSVAFSWEGVPTASGYEVALVSPDETAVWDPPYRIVSGTSTTFEIKEGLAGRPYRVAIRAFSPAGKSPDALSPILRIEDAVPPSVAVSPTNPMGKVSFHLSMTDDLALDRFLVWWTRDGSDDKMLVHDGLLTGNVSNRVVEWVVPEAALGQEIEWRFEVIDSGENASTAALRGAVGLDGTVEVFGAR